MSKTKEEILSSKAVYISEGETTGIKSDVLSAMDEFARQEAIEFAEWIKKYWSISRGAYRHRGDFYHNDKHRYTTSQLYQLFINSKMPSKVK